MPDSFNKGEWAELYVFFYVLGEGKLRCADEGMNELKGNSFAIDYVRRKEKNAKEVDYLLDYDSVHVRWGSTSQITIPKRKFTEYASKLKFDIQQGRGHAFSISDDVISFMHSVLVYQPKARSIQSTNSADNIGGKCDIVMHYHDPWSQLAKDGGFSIKSAFSSPATLFNASQGSNFEFLVDTDDRKFVDSFNGLYTSQGSVDLVARGDLLRQMGHHLTSIGPHSNNNGESPLKTNLMTLRPDLLEILPEMLRLSLVDENHPMAFPDLCNKLVEENPQNVANPDVYYQKAIKDFLYASFAGMTAAKPWDSTMQVNGGYIIVTNSWKVLSYPTTNEDQFKNYLFYNVKLDRPSCTRNKYGTIYEAGDGTYRLNMNLQVRFIG